ncbi:hypothetical protein Goshw_003390 [Gossypium schwendimanii]|uniref:Uncharacterized protein n=1 Tax=Gossypium schwendimanii TaxID=34291 RepID=A0A7J9KJH8_GOSSC|nr:hypothetical protein [Gossypium schwendimanii]
MKDDIDELKAVMDFINNYPFGSAIQGKNVALQICKFLVEHDNDDGILRSHQLVYYENKWLLMLEHSENMVTHFNKNERE